MRLSAAQQEKVAKQLTDLGGGKAAICPVCRHDDWRVIDTVFELPQHDDDSGQIEHVVLPVLPLTCITCGHTIFLNAITLGLIASSAAPGAATEGK